MRLILLGAPGAGKGTQAEHIMNKYHIPVIGTGNIIREAMKTGTEAGRKAKEYVQSGGLVPDEIVIAMLQDRIKEDDCKDGFILDGFPRTVPQAEALDRMGVELDKVIDLDVADEDIMKRLGGRTVCKLCGVSYHSEHNPPHKPGVCDKDGGELIVRADDAPETIRERLRVYHEQTEPLKEYYAGKGKLHTVRGKGTVEQTTELIYAAIEGKNLTGAQA